MIEHLYLSAPALVCFDGETETPPVETPNTPPGSPVAELFQGVTFSPEQQEKMNKIYAEEKRKHQQQYKAIETRLQETLNTAKLSQDERAKLEETLDGVRKELLTKEEKAKHEKRKLEEEYTGKIADLERRASSAEQRYTESVVHRSLLDAAVLGDAFNPEIVVTVLKQHVKMENDQVVIDFPDEEAETRNPIITRRTPADAVARMKELTDKYGGLFKSNIVSGVGGSSATGGLTPGANGRVDVTKLSPEQYRKIRKENPELLGLSRSR